MKREQVKGTMYAKELNTSIISEFIESIAPAAVINAKLKKKKKQPTFHQSQILTNFCDLKHPLMVGKNSQVLKVTKETCIQHLIFPQAGCA